MMDANIIAATLRLDPLHSAAADHILNASDPIERAIAVENGKRLLSAIRAGQTTAEQPASATADAISAQNLTRVVTKAEAARLHSGQRKENPSDYIARQVKAGCLTSPVGSGKSWQFDIRQFPESVRNQLC